MVSAKIDKLAPGLLSKLCFGVDFISALVAVIVACGSLEQAATAPALVYLGGAAWAIAATVLRLYSPYTPRSAADEAVLRVIAVVSVAVTVMLLAHFIAPDSHFSPQIFGALHFAIGTTVRFVTAGLVGEGDEPDNVLILGTGALGVATYDRLREGSGRFQKHVTGFLRFKGEPDLPRRIPLVAGEATDLLSYLSDNPVDEVYVAARVLERGAEVQKAVEVCEQVGVLFALPVHSVRLHRATLRSSSRATDGYLHYLSTQPKPVQAAVKRLADIVISSIALSMLSPLLIGVAIAIKLTSKGPIFFRQERVGLHGARFGLLKFRSMVVNAEELKAKLLARNEQTGPVFKIRDDPRVTRVGKFIRKYSIDELPQLVNILRGDMTIVGPRPPLPTEVAQYKEWQRRRLSVRPGLTCFWQVSGRNDISFEDWMRLDLRYVDHWSLGLDVRLILQTVPVVLAGRGAS